MGPLELQSSAAPLQSRFSGTDHKHGKLNKNLYSRLHWDKDEVPTSKADHNVSINIAELVAQDTLIRPRTEVQGTAYDSDASEMVESEDDSESDDAHGSE